MTVIDQSGNIHRSAGAPGGGQFAGKVNAAPKRALTDQDDVTEPTPEFHQVWDGRAEHAKAAYAHAMISILIEPGDPETSDPIHAIGPETALQILASDAPDEDVAAQLGGRIPAAKVHAARGKLRNANDSFKDAAEAGIRVVTAAEGGIPSQFAALGTRAPFAFWAKGDVALLSTLETGVTFTGTRAGTAYGEHVAAELASDQAASGRTIVGGGAYGIESASQRAALMAGGRAIVFLPAGVDRPYPVGNAQLHARAAENGLLISEVPPRTAPTKWRFMARNRLLAAATPLTVIVEASANSTSMQTAIRAKQMGRQVAAVPGPITSAASLGANQLIRDGIATAIADSRDVTELAQNGVFK